MGCEVIPNGTYSLKVAPILKNDSTVNTVNKGNQILVDLPLSAAALPEYCKFYASTMTLASPGPSCYFNSWMHSLNCSSGFLKVDRGPVPAEEDTIMVKALCGTQLKMRGGQLYGYGEAAYNASRAYTGPECQSYFLVYGRVASDGLGIDDAVVLKCKPRLEKSYLDVQLSLPNFDLDPSKVALVPNTTTVVTSYDIYNFSTQLVPDPRLLGGQFAPVRTNDSLTSAVDPLFRSMIHGVNGTPAVELLHPQTLIEKLNKNMGIIAAPLLQDDALRYIDTNLSASSYSNITATLHMPARERVFQNMVSTRILQALLASMMTAGILSVLILDTSAILPKNPMSIAALASLVADSKMMKTDEIFPKDSEWYNDRVFREECGRNQRFAMGWWTEDGIRIQIDEEKLPRWHRYRFWQKEHHSHDTEKAKEGRLSATRGHHFGIDYE